jgi:glycosyltransferase involved in cell wall biosynthesis
MAHVLAGHGHPVVLASIGRCTVTSPSVECCSVDGAALRTLVAGSDVVVFQGFLLRDFPWLSAAAPVLVADMYDPVHLEVLEQERHRPMRERVAEHRSSLETVNEQLSRADFFLCASPKQRDFWLGHLASLGRVSPASYDGDEDLEQLIAVAPFGLSSTPPVHRRQVVKGVVPGIGVDDKVVIWGGGIYSWFDPLTLLRAVEQVRHLEPRVRLYFLGTKHPNPAVPAMRMAVTARALSDELGLTGSVVFFNDGWVGYDERADYLLEADVGVSCHLPHVETAYSFRTRILDYLWAGLPIVTTAGDGFGDLVAARELGAAVPAEDVAALAAALLLLLADDGVAAGCAQRVRDVALDFTWERALAPLVAFCADPRPARDRRQLPPVAAPTREGHARLDPARVRAAAYRVRVAWRAGGLRELTRRGLGWLQRRLG